MTMTALAQYLTQRGITQADFATRLGVECSTVCRWASGKRYPGVADAIAIESATGGEVPLRSWAVRRHNISVRKRALRDNPRKAAPAKRGGR